MPITPVGLFDSFDDLDQISVEAVSSWLKPVPQLTQLENYLANKILYPQSLPLTKQDMQIDLAILREALKMNALSKGNPFLNTTLRKILIPVRFLTFVPDLASLVIVFIDALLFNRTKKNWFQDIWTIVLSDSSDKIIGSLVLPQFEDKNALMQVTLLGRNYDIHPGELVVLPCPKDRCEIGYSFQRGKILGKLKNAVEIYGGKLGLVIDGRNV